MQFLVTVYDAVYELKDTQKQDEGARTDMRVEGIAPVPYMYDGLLGHEKVCIDLKRQIRQCDAQHEIAEKGSQRYGYEYTCPLEMYRSDLHLTNDNE